MPPYRTFRISRRPAYAAYSQKPILSVEHLSLWYGDAQALKDVSLEIPERRITAFIGPSGCGKSTLLRCFNRLNDRKRSANRVSGSG